VLTLGIGATTAIFSVVDAVVIRGLPFDEHDRLIAVGTRRPPPPEGDPSLDPLRLTSVAPQDFADWDSRQDVFTHLAATTGSSMTLGEAGQAPEDLRALRATADLFEVLRIAPAVGRAFTSGEETDGRHRVAVLSHALWQRRFGGDPAVLGRRITLDGAAYDVIGVMPAGTTYPPGAARPTDLYVPYVVPEHERVRDPDWQSIYLQVVGRLKPGVDIEQAEAQMTQIGRALQAEHPQWNRDTNVGVRPLHDHVVGSRTRTWMLMLLGAVGLVLVIACVNVATLQLARAVARERELGVRAALGATRWRLARQLLVESVLLSCGGAVLGMLVAWWGVDTLRAAMPEGVARVSDIAVNLRVLGASALMALGTGVVFGLAPAWRGSRPDVNQTLKEGARGAVGHAHQRWSGALVVVEVALALVLLVGASLFIGSFAALMRVQPGFDAANVLTTRVAPADRSRRPPADHRRQLQAIVDRVATLPGVTNAAYIVGGLPLTGSMSVTVVGRPGVDEPVGDVSVRHVTDDYHATMRIPLRSGRRFADTDREGSPRVAVVSESLARLSFPSEPAVGRELLIDNQAWSIVGVVGDVHQTSLESDPLPEVYLPLAQTTGGAGELVVRTSVTASGLLGAVEAAVAAELPAVPLRNVQTMEQLVGRQLAQRRLNMLLLSLFGVLGVVIAAVGLYGVLAFAVAQRTREMGVRMALGASRGAVVSLVLNRAAAWVLMGLVLGLGGAWALRSVASAFLFGLEATDGRAFLAALAVLMTAAGVASVMPAVRAARVDPMAALRAD
jgi:predicted permease